MKSVGRDMDQIITRVQKLRALAQSDNVNEANAAAAAADKLIQEHRLEEAELEIDTGRTTEQADEESEPLAAWRRTPSWQLHLAVGLAGHYDVATYSIVARGGGQSIHMVGRHSDAVAVRMMHAWLMAEIDRLAKNATDGQGRRWVNAFRNGAVRGVLRSMTESKRAAMVEAPQSARSTALVLARRKDQADARLAELHPDLKSQRVHLRVGSADGFNEGLRAGRDLDLSAARTPRLQAPK